jgi:hypothetical protein
MDMCRETDRRSRSIIVGSVDVGDANVADADVDGATKLSLIQSE